MKKDINSFMGERVGMTKDLKALKEDRSKMIYDIKKLIQERGNILSDMRQSMKDKITMSEDIENLIQDRKTLMSDLRTTLEDTKVMKKDIQKLVKENSILKKKVRRYNEESYEDIEPAEVPEMDYVQDTEYSNENYDLSVDPSMAYASDDEDFGGIPFTNYNDESGFLENKSRKTNKKSRMKEFVIRKKPSQNRDVVEYFENKVKEKPILRKIREQIVSQPSLVKAVNMIERYLRNDEEKPYRIMESVKSRHYDWVGNRDI
jgi:chromosome segregation ATPase